MPQKVRKKFKKSIQEDVMPREEKLVLREIMKATREFARNELATNLTLTDKQKLDHIVDYIVGVPLEE